MSNIEIIKKLQERHYINTYISFLINCNKGVQTRHQSNLNTVACRLWQLQYCIFTIIYSKNPKLIDDPKFLLNLCPFYLNFYQRESLLFSFIAKNELPNPSNRLNALYYRENPTEFKEYINSNDNTYLCIYGIDKKSGRIFTTGIVHYFTIIKSETEDFYITSSYGSEQVKVPYTIEKLEALEEFLTFCEFLKDSKNNEDFITAFMMKYFLSNALEIRYSEEAVEFNKSLRFKIIPPFVGEKREINYILLNTLMNFDVAIITNYREIVEEGLPSLEVAGIINTRVNYKKTKRKLKKTKRKLKKSKKQRSKKIKLVR